MVSKLVIGIAVLVVAALAIGGLGLSSPTTGNAIAGEETLKIPLSELSGNAKWYEYADGGVKIRFFAVRANDGTIKTAFDACDVCYRSHKGYREEGGYMVCNNCGNRYLISSLGVENRNPGGCWPGYLPNYISGDSLIVKKSDLTRSRWRFS